MREIKVTVSPDGTTKIATKGYTGHACKNATQELEKALGAIKEEKLTGEYYERDTKNNLHISNGGS